MSSIFITISVILGLVSSFVYFIAILKGEAKPHRTTRLVFLFISALTTFSLFAQGNRVALWLSAVSTFQSVVIFLLSLKYGMGGRSKTDILCLLIAFVGIASWQLTKDPTSALYFAIAADFTGIIPTLIKTYHFPYTEVWTFYFLDVCAGIFNIIATKTFTFSQFIYPLYIITINLFIVFLIKRKVASKKHQIY
ncbi:hypothetical protein HZA75_04280 [Candidatus Roizmanbacteria bacterium]|nr:hypothetical protein [Candidatus Roizmanbacteria bacterium]